MALATMMSLLAPLAAEFAVLTLPVLLLAMIPAIQFDSWQWLSLTMAATLVVWVPVIAQVMQADKVEVIRRLRAEGRVDGRRRRQRRFGPDQGRCGIAIGAGSYVETRDFVHMRSDWVYYATT